MDAGEEGVEDRGVSQEGVTNYNYDLRFTNYELRITNYDLRITMFVIYLGVQE